MYEIYYRILECSPGASPVTVKRAYHRKCKENHPDLFPESERRRQELAMMRINEAYMTLATTFMSEGAGSANFEGTSSASFGASAHSEPFPDNAESNYTTAVGHLKDPAYTYYKLGFEHYRKGYTSLAYRKQRIKGRDEFTESFQYDRYILQLSINALQHFRESYRYFSVVTTDYADTPWAPDARYKLSRITGFNRIYQRICQNISDHIKETDHLFSRKP
jgi:curved DNA-binding protein CbpA